MASSLRLWSQHGQSAASEIARVSSPNSQIRWHQEIFVNISLGYPGAALMERLEFSVCRTSGNLRPLLKIVPARVPVQNGVGCIGAHPAGGGTLDWAAAGQVERVPSTTDMACNQLESYHDSINQFFVQYGGIVACLARQAVPSEKLASRAAQGSLEVTAAVARPPRARRIRAVERVGRCASVGVDHVAEVGIASRL